MPAYKLMEITKNYLKKKWTTRPDFKFYQNMFKN